MKTNKYAVVTGGSDGIGLAIAEEFAKSGINICIIGRDKKKLDAASERLSNYDVEVFTMSTDLSQMSQVTSLSKDLLSTLPQVDILVNNAGIGRFIPFADMDEALLDLHLDLNIKAPYMLTKYLLESLTQSKGCVINISSYFADRMIPDRASTAYSLTKGAINSFTKSLAFELGPLGIRVNAVAPGSINTPLFNSNLEKLSADARLRFEEMIKTIYPLGKIGMPEDVAKTVLFLASDSAKWITGSIISVDGGLTTN